MVPGVNVAQINSNVWAISIRGFNGEFSNKLLVMVDGRSVYLPSFSGVFWDVLDVPLEDIARIEVIRGPGGTTWGANAVDGVINIITKKASESRGGMVVAGGGNLNQGFGTAQYGGTLGQSTDYRVFAKYFNQEHQPNIVGSDGGDGWHSLREVSALTANCLRTMSLRSREICTQRGSAASIPSWARSLRPSHN